MIWPHVVYWAGSALDFYSTKRGLDHGAKEANPAMRWLIAHWGVAALAGAKAVLYAGFLISDVPAWTYYAAGGVFLAAGAWNTWGVKR